MEKLVGTLNPKPLDGHDVLCPRDRRNDRMETEASGQGYRRFDHQIRVLSQGRGRRARRRVTSLAQEVGLHHLPGAIPHPTPVYG